MQKMKKLLSRSGPIMAARIIQLVFGFLVTFLVAGWLPPAELGTYYMSTAVSIGCHFILLNSLHFPIQRLMPSDGLERKRYISTVFLLSNIFIIFFLALYFVDRLMIGWDLGLIVICASFAFSESLFSQVTNTTSAMRQSVLYFFVVLLRSVTIFSLFWLFKTEAPAADVAIFFFVLGNLISSFCLVWVNRSEFSFTYFSWSVVKMNFLFSRAYSLSNIFVQIISRGDRLMIGIALGPVVSGVYSVASDLSRRTLQGICVNSRLAFVRDAVDSYVEGDKNAVDAQIYKIICSVLIVGVPAACVMSVFSVDIFRKLLPESIIDGSGHLWKFAPFVFLCEALRSYGYSLPFELSKKTVLETAVTATGCIIFVVAFLPLVKWLGIEGAALALAITFNVMIFQSVLIAKWKVGISMPLLVSYVSISLGYLSAHLMEEMALWWSGMPLLALLSVASFYGAAVMACQAGICYLLRPRVRS